jgi:hypothetical protein
MRTLTRALAVLLGLAILVTPQMAWASWVSNNCYSSWTNDSIYRRTDARAYTDVARYEGYEWGGGCWNDNNTDDTPGQPDSNGEGPDCSGLVFKSWELRPTWGETGGRWYNKYMNIHGPYNAASFHGPVGDLPFHNVPKLPRSSMYYMDAFAKVGHVGLLYTIVNTHANLDWIIEGAGDKDGVNKFERGYRYDSAYTGVYREGWSPDCYPQCQSPPPPNVVVVP